VPEPASPSPENLSQADLVRLVLELRRELDALKAENGRLRAENEALKRRSKRSAAPFSRDSLAVSPRSPGRKAGQGLFQSRPSPQADELTEPPIEVPVHESSCPDCGGALGSAEVELASITDLPEVVRPEVRQYRVSVCRCTSCGKKVRGRHPDLWPDQHGASANRLGPRAFAAAHSLHYGLGLPQRKVPLVLKELTGLSLSQGTLVRDAGRRTEADGEVGQRYQALRVSIKEAEQVHTDDTGWRVGGQTAHLMVFKTSWAVVFQIRERHRNDEVRELIPGDYTGVMICDRFFSYDAAALSKVKQQKCVSHVLRSISAVLEEHQGKQGGALASVFGKSLKSTVRDGLVAWQEHRAGTLDEAGFKARASEVLARLDHQLRDRTLTTTGN